MAKQTSLFDGNNKINNKTLDLLVAYRKKHGIALKSALHIKRLIEVLADENPAIDGKNARLDAENIHQILLADEELVPVDDAMRERIFSSIPPGRRKYSTFATTFCKFAAECNIYINSTQAQNLSDRWSLVLEGTTTTRTRGAKRAKAAAKFPKLAENSKTKKIGFSRLNAQSNFLVDVLAAQFDTSKSTLVNAAIVFLAREIRNGRGDDFLDALEFQLPHVRALASTLSCRPRHVDKRALKDKIVKYITNYDL